MEAPKPKADMNRAGGGFLKPGDLKRPVQVPIDARRAAKDTEETGPLYVPEFDQVVIPVTISDIPKVVQVSVKSGDYADLCKVFGPDFRMWVGCTIQVHEDPNFRKLRVRPIATPAGPAAPAAGKPVA